MNNKIKYQRDYTKFGEFYQLVLPLSFERHIASFKGRNSYSKTDPDATAT